MSELRAAGGGPPRIYRACILYAAGRCWPPPLALTFAGTRPRERIAGQKHSPRRVSNCRWPALPHQASWAQRCPSDSIHRRWSQSSPCSKLPSTSSRGRKYPSPRTDHERDYGAVARPLSVNTVDVPLEVDAPVARGARKEVALPPLGYGATTRCGARVIVLVLP